MQAIEFKTTLQNGTLTVPSEYSGHWEGKIIRVILLDDTPILESKTITQTDRATTSPEDTQQDQDASDSLFARLKQIEISGPSDFSENLDAYLNGEKDA
mgnify:CR=1 FL=1